MTLFFTPPPQLCDPIYIAGSTPGSVAWLANSEGFHVHPLNSAKYVTEVVRPALLEGAQKSGRSLDDVAISVSVFIVTGENDQQTAFWREFVRSRSASMPAHRRTG
jgi:alkanesulfonate monooxygenase SsuD/methylene tetrahydromethanopterin reductase-like flavin-dependent oxidoreductase (luciferase family)